MREEPSSEPEVVLKHHAVDDYFNLDPKLVVHTIDLLEERIKERFPDRGLRKVCARLQSIAARSQETMDWVSRPIWSLRLGIAALLFLIAAGLLITLQSANPAKKALTFVEIIPLLESGMNDVILIGAGILFLATVESRIKRKRALEAVHELRSLVHIIDMHQLTKDPERLRAEHRETESSPHETMTRYELNRYLDYSSEMLSLCAKLAALYAQHFADSVVLAAVGEVETLSLGLSGKIWQKIAILQAIPDENCSRA